MTNKWEGKFEENLLEILYRQDQPRHPAGTPEGGRFAPEGGSGAGGVPQFTPAKTVSEAEDWARNNLNMEVNYSGVQDVRIANIVNEELVELYNNLNGFDVETPWGEKLKLVRGISTEKLDADTIAEYRLGNKIFLNETYFRDLTSYEPLMDKKVMVGVHPKQIISHEVGHAIGKTDTEVHSIKMDIFKRYGNNTGMSVASPYSMLSSDEMVAEAFVIFRDYGRISKQFGALSELDPVFRRVMTSGVKL